jgi:adenylate kinase
VLRALLLAPPGAGKGTQGERIAEIYGVPHIATGELLRNQVELRTPAGEMAKDFMQRGELVPDDLIIGLVLDQVADDEPLPGFVLDGFPRTMTQARAAYEWASANDRTFHAVIRLEVPTDELVERLLERGRIANRVDDTAETILRRLSVYSDSTAPLVEFYRARAILVEIDGTGSAQDVTSRIRSRLDELDLD